MYEKGFFWSRAKYGIPQDTLLSCLSATLREQKWPHFTSQFVLWENWSLLIKWIWKTNYTTVLFDKIWSKMKNFLPSKVEPMWTGLPFSDALSHIKWTVSPFLFSLSATRSDWLPHWIVQVGKHFPSVSLKIVAPKRSMCDGKGVLTSNGISADDMNAF